MNKPRSTLSKSLFYLFDLYLVILIVEMFRCISLHKVGRTVIFPFLVVLSVCFFVFVFFVPNLLRKAVKVEGTQEVIVGTKHSREQLDVINVIYQFYPSFHY